jgi:hypothetical protein
MKKEAIKQEGSSDYLSVVATMILTAVILIIVQNKTPQSMLMLARFYPSLYWLEIVLLAGYAGILVQKILDNRLAVKWRRRLWLIFSIVFYGQLLLGLSGLTIFLLSGKLHLPIPALIMAAPIYRGSGFFMTTLFAITLIFIGPAWCSYFCYLGGWDLLAASRKRYAKKMPAWRQPLRIGIAVVIALIAFLLRYFSLSVQYAVYLASIYGIGAIFIIYFFSRQQGCMVHCTTYCPIGLIANIFGKISPFRIKIANTCDNCMRCTLKCRYDALSRKQIKQKRPGTSCTL